MTSTPKNEACSRIFPWKLLPSEISVQLNVNTNEQSTSSGSWNTQRIRKTVVLRPTYAMCHPFSTLSHRGDHHPAHTHAHTSLTRISSLIASKLTALSSVGSHLKEAAAPNRIAAFRSSHACFPMHVPPATMAIQCVCNPSSTRFSNFCQWRGEKRAHTGAHFWFVSFCDFPLSTHLRVPAAERMQYKGPVQHL